MEYVAQLAVSFVVGAGVAFVVFVLPDIIVYWWDRRRS